MTTYAVGDLLREWRTLRRRSQMDLAFDVGVSPRHLSFVENGRSRPSAELLLSLAEGLDLPLHERNTLLLAAGYAPRDSRRGLDHPSMAHARNAVQRMLDAHDPYPGVAIDHRWNVVATNAAAAALAAMLPDELLGPPLNVYRACLHPDGLAAVTLNFDEWSAYLLGQLHRAATLTGDPELRALKREVGEYPNLAPGQRRSMRSAEDREPPLLVPVRLVVDGVELSLFTTLTTFGTPRDVTLDGFAVELSYPADRATETALRGWSQPERHDWMNALSRT